MQGQTGRSPFSGLRNWGQSRLSPVYPWRQELLRMFDELAAATAQLDLAVEQAAKHQPLAVRLMTHPGVGPVTSLAHNRLGRDLSAPRVRFARRLASAALPTNDQGKSIRFIIESTVPKWRCFASFKT